MPIFLRIFSSLHNCIIFFFNNLVKKDIIMPDVVYFYEQIQLSKFKKVVENKQRKKKKLFLIKILNKLSCL